MPGLPPSTDGSPTVFARLQVAESPPLVLTDLNTNTEITGNSLIICPRGELAISAVSEWVLG